MDYAACRDALERAEADVSVAEFHGTLCAMLCTRPDVSMDTCVSEIVVCEHPPEGSAWSRVLREHGERSRRAQTAIQNWLDVDDALVASDFPDAQLLLEVYEDIGRACFGIAGDADPYGTRQSRVAAAIATPASADDKFGRAMQ